MSVAPLLQLEAALLRRQMPDLLLRPGMTLFARVAERQGQHGILVPAGSPLVAQLPDEVQAGDKLHLLVEDTRGERVTMKLVQDQPVAPPHNPAIGLPLPDGTQARLTVEEDEYGGGGDGPEDAPGSVGHQAPPPGRGGALLAPHTGGGGGGA